MSQTQVLNHSRKNLWSVIFWAGLLVGTLDITGAIINSLANNGNPKMIFQYIASALFGKEAFAGDSLMSILGGVFHYAVAYSFTIFFFLIYPKLFPIGKQVADGRSLWNIHLVRDESFDCTSYTDQ